MGHYRRDCPLPESEQKAWAPKGGGKEDKGGKNRNNTTPGGKGGFAKDMINGWKNRFTKNKNGGPGKQEQRGGTGTGGGIRALSGTQERSVPTGASFRRIGMLRTVTQPIETIVEDGQTLVPYVKIYGNGGERIETEADGFVKPKKTVKKRQDDEFRQTLHDAMTCRNRFEEFMSPANDAISGESKKGRWRSVPEKVRSGNTGCGGCQDGGC